VKMSEVIELIDQVKKENRLSFTEAESKKLLSRYGIPVVEEKVVATAKEALLQAGATGFPVVLKGLGAKLTHKTERGLVKINLCSMAAVRRAYRDIRESAGDDWEGCLIQPQIEGKREFVAGLFRDSQFGPVVMFGLGGVFTEAIGDVAFRIAPVSDVQAQDLISEITSRQLLGDFRGEAAADRAQLIAVLTGLSQLGMDHPEIKEVDINPLIVMPDGRMKAVDALVVLGGSNAGISAANDVSGEEAQTRTAEIRAALDAVTHARAVAVIGATNPGRGFPGMFGCMRKFGFRGNLYPVNPKYEEIAGLKAYPNLISLPEKVDLVIISVPAPFVAEALKDCVASGNRNVHIFSSGFKETGEADGIRMQEEIEKIALAGGLHVVGPNCMGFYVPARRMLTWTGAYEESGPVSFISQSGGNAQDFSNYASSRYGIYFNKVISYGNALTLDSTDFLDYLARDEETRIITMYLEGVKDGRLLLNLVREINRRKPVIIYKGGLTEAGARAVSSHTGSLAGGRKIWQAFFRQTGAVAVESLEEMADVTLAFHHIGKAPGRRSTVLGIGGGIGVSVADSCARSGLELPQLSPETIKNLRSYIPPAGTMIRNPIDAVIAFRNLDIMGHILELLAASGEIDNFFISVPLDWLYGEEDGGSYIEKIANYLAAEGPKFTHGKPLVVVWRQYQPDPAIRKCVAVMEKILLSAGIPVYEGLPRAITALAKLAGYSEFQEKHK
jgi:acyl-CoA synthetase (NDP forming)